MLAPAEAICAVRSASPPGRSLITAVNGEPAIRHQASFDHATQDVGIDVSSAEEKNHPLSGQFREVPGQTGGEGSGGGTFDHAFFQFHDAQDGDGNLFLRHSDNAIDQRRGGGERIAANLGDGEAIGEGGLGVDPDWFSLPHGRRETGDVFRFHRDDPGLGPQTFDGERHARQQPAAAYRHDHGIQIGHLFHDLESHCALAGDDGRIVVARYKPDHVLSDLCAWPLPPKAFPCRTTFAPSFWQYRFDRGANSADHRGRNNEQLPVSERWAVARMPRSRAL